MLFFLSVKFLIPRTFYGFACSVIENESTQLFSLDMINIKIRKTFTKRGEKNFLT